jgi:hypothetical protein
MIMYINKIKINFFYLVTFVTFAPLLIRFVVRTLVFFVALRNTVSESSESL